MMILAKAPVREEFASCSSSNNYYETKGDAVSTFDAVLREFGLRFDNSQIIDMPGDNGRINIDVVADVFECSKCVGCAVLSWYRMPSGRYEFVGYLA